MAKQGIYVSPTEFVSFAQARQGKSLSGQIATRERSMDMSFGFLLPNPDPILKRQGKDISVYRDMRSRASVGGPIRRRKAAVKALEWRVERGKASARMARLAGDLLASYDMDRLLNEITDAVLFGYQPLELVWGPFKGATAPLEVIGKPQEWFFFDSAAELRFRSREQPLRGEELEPRKFLLARQEASYANPYGFADLSMCFWADTFMRGGLKFWVTFTEKYGTPWLVGKQPRGTPGPEVDKLLDKLEAMVQDAVAAIPDDSSIDILEAGEKGASADLYERLLMYCRSEINIALLGQNQSTEASSNRASAVAGLEVASTIRDGDARLAEATINQLLRWVTDLHDGEQAPAPTFELFEEEDVNTKQAERDEMLSRAGLHFKPAYWKRVYQLQDGDIEEAPVAPTTLAAAAAGPVVAFAEGAPATNVTDATGQVLGTAAAPVVADWVRELRALVDAHDDAQALQDAVLAAYGDLPTADLTEVMALAFELAHLQGRERAALEAGNA
jgi:phage gp29-like protein